MAISMDSYYVIRNIHSNKFLRFTVKTKDLLETELDIERRGSFYSDNLFIGDFYKAVQIRSAAEARTIHNWLEEICKNSYELLAIDILGTKAS